MQILPLDVERPELTLRELYVLKAALIEIKDRAVTGTIELGRYGICHNWRTLVDNCQLVFEKKANDRGLHYERVDGDIAYAYVEYVAATFWEKAENSKSYPVPKTNYLWKGKGLELRLELIDLILDKLQVAISESVTGLPAYINTQLCPELENTNAK